MFVTGYEFSDARKSLCEFRYFIAQVNQEISRCHSIRFAADGNRCGDTVGGEFVRYETAVAKRPQELIEALGVIPVLRMNIDGVLEAICLFRQSTGQHVARMFIDPVENVKVDSCHEVLGQRAGARQQHFTEHCDRPAGGAFLRAGFPGYACNIKMRPVQAVSESAQKTTRGDRTAA